MENIKIHPVYKNYGYNVETQQAIHISKNVPLKHKQIDNCYHNIGIKHNGGQKRYSLHRFIWECYNDVIPKGYEIDHINHIKSDNNILNLRCITLNENRKHRDHTNIIKFGRIAHTLKKIIKAIDKSNENNHFCFNCKNQCAKYFNISPAMVYLICEHKNNAKFANTNKGIFYFEYIDENDVTNLVKIPHGKLLKNNFFFNS